ncbi:hypothetical protein ACFFRR_000234 [Megaselia abdita]
MFWILLLQLSQFFIPSKPYNEQHRLQRISNDTTHVPRSNQEMMTYSAYSFHPCYRLCRRGDRRTCYFNIVVDSFYTKADCGNCPKNMTDCFRPHCVTTDGVPTEFLAYNYQLPGPILSVCEGDTIIIHVTNYLSEMTTIHPHGMTMWATPYMDGVPYVSQYPINPFQTFVQNFLADRSGSLWYHSHVGSQRGFGLFGAFIIRVPDELNPMKRFYDIDSNRHVIVLCDWPINFNATILNILVNGKGHDQKREYDPPVYAQFNVIQSKRYRFRVIFAGTASCSLEFSIQYHTLLLISVDGNDIEAIKISSFVIMPAQRFDFVLTANQKVDNYWIQVRGLTGCAPMVNGAVLHYEGASNALPKESLMNEVPEGIQVNTLDAVNLDNPKQKPVYTLNALIKKYPVPVKCKIYLTMDFIISGGVFTARINKISGTSPTVSVTHAKDYIQDNYFCNKTSLKNDGLDCESSLCKCRHTINLPRNTFCEIFMVNEMTIQHPMHLHGFIFRVVGAGKLSAEERKDIQNVDYAKPFPRRQEGAPLVDVVQLPSTGYTIIWVYTNNSGYWLFHCHIEGHMLAGMQLLFKVGEAKDMIPVPKPSLTCL